MQPVATVGSLSPPLELLQAPGPLPAPHGLSPVEPSKPTTSCRAPCGLRRQNAHPEPQHGGDSTQSLATGHSPALTGAPSRFSRQAPVLRGPRAPGRPQHLRRRVPDIWQSLVLNHSRPGWWKRRQETALSCSVAASPLMPVRVVVRFTKTVSGVSGTQGQLLQASLGGVRLGPATTSRQARGKRPD